MRTIEYATAFRRDFKREKRGVHKNLDQSLTEIVQLLLQDAPLTQKYRDHKLSGSWEGFRECHVKPDLLLIYDKTPTVLRLARLGSHSELFKR